jgi:hypothetical protein
MDVAMRALQAIPFFLAFTSFEQQGTILSKAAIELVEAV